MHRVLLATIVTACAHASTVPPVGNGPATEVLLDTEALRRTDSSASLVVVLRDVDAPDRPVASIARLAIGPVGGDLRSSSAAVRFIAVSDSRAVIARADSGLRLFEARAIGYEPYQFTARLRSGCRQTLEIYLGRRLIALDGRHDPPPSQGRAVLTTCRRLRNAR